MKKLKLGVIAGNFDVIHPGYIYMFNECKENCDLFYVLLHEDPSYERPEKLKPVLTLDERMSILLSLRQVDYVIPYKTEDDLKSLLINLNPDVRFLGDDYVGKKYTGDDLGIEIHFINRDHGWSTTKFKKMIKETL